MASDDPEFERKATDIIGLYLNPPQHAAVFCVDGESAFRRWIGSIRSCRCRRAEPSATALNTMATATLSLYAALDVRTGKVHGKTAARHTSDEFVYVLHDVVGLCQPKQEIHVILDNLSAHKT